MGMGYQNENKIDQLKFVISIQDMNFMNNIASEQKTPFQTSLQLHFIIFNNYLVSCNSISTRSGDLF